MAFTETVLKIRDSISEEQSTELREFLVEACQQLQADPELMGMGLQRLKEELTDQGYEWENLVGTMLQLIEPSLTVESVKKLKAAWNDSIASNATIADLTAILNSDFPIINEVFRDLVNEALEEHSALSGLAGGTHIGKALASPWNKNSKLNKKQRTMAEAAEIGLGGAAGAAAFFGGRAAGRAIYAAGEKRQLWGAINTKIGGKDGPSIKDMISGDLPGDGQGPHFMVPVEDREKVLGDIINARDALIEKSGPLSKDEEASLYENAKAILLPRKKAFIGDDGRIRGWTPQDRGGEINPNHGKLYKGIESSLHPGQLYRDYYAAIDKHLTDHLILPNKLREPLADIDQALIEKNIRINDFNAQRLEDHYNKDPLKPDIEPPPSDLEHADVILESAKMNFDLISGRDIDSDHPIWNEYIESIRTKQLKLQLLDYAKKTNRPIEQILDEYSQSINSEDVEHADALAKQIKSQYKAARDGKKIDAFDEKNIDGIPFSQEEKAFFDAARNMDLDIGFGNNPDFDKDLQARVQGYYENAKLEFGSKGASGRAKTMAQFITTDNPNMAIPNGLTRDQLKPSEIKMLNESRMSRYTQNNREKVQKLMDDLAGGGRPSDKEMGEIRKRVWSDIKEFFGSSLEKDIISDPKARTVNMEDFKGEFEYDPSGKLTIKKTSSWAEDLVNNGDVGIREKIANTDLRRDRMVLGRDASEVESNRGNLSISGKDRISDVDGLPRNISGIDNNQDLQRDLLRNDSVISKDLAVEAKDAEREASSAIRSAGTDAEQAAGKEMTNMEDDMI